MYSNNYCSSFELLNTSIHRDDSAHTDPQTIDHYRNSTTPSFDVHPYLQNAFAPTSYRDTVTKQLLGSKYDSYMLNLHGPAIDDSIIGLTNLDYEQPTFQRIIESPGDPNDAILNHYMIMMNQSSPEYPIEQTNYTESRPFVDDEFATRSQVNKQLQKHSVSLSKPRESIDPLDLIIRDPTVDYTLFTPVNESFTSSQSQPTSSSNNSQYTLDSNINLNQSVPIMFENFAPTSCNISRSEAFRSNTREYFGHEAFSNIPEEPNMGVYESSLSNNFGPPSCSGSGCPLDPHAPPKNTESFTYASKSDELAAPIAIESYLNTLKARATAVCFYLQHNKSYSKWRENWNLLYDNLHKKNKLLFQRLDESDADVAYVVNKGDEVKFRIRDEKRFIPLNVYQYVLYHEMAHMSTHELQHTPFFFELLSIIALAAMEMGFIDLVKLKPTYYKTNGQPILCKVSMVTELVNACDHLTKANPNSKAYFEGLKAYIKRK